MTCRLTDIAGKVYLFKLLGFKRSDPPKVLVVEHGTPMDSMHTGAYSYFLHMGQRAGLIEYREAAPCHVLGWELRSPGEDDGDGE